MQLLSRNKASFEKPLQFNNEKSQEKKRNIIKLCSQRLLPTRHQTKNAILSILNDGEVKYAYYLYKYYINSFSGVC